MRPKEQACANVSEFQRRPGPARQQFPDGVVLLTGAGIRPPDSFILAAGGRGRVSRSGIGVLDNTVAAV